MSGHKQSRRIQVKGTKSADSQSPATEETPQAAAATPEAQTVVEEPEVVNKTTPEPQPEPTAATPAVDWRDMALRLQAEMDNYRKRQERRAEDRIHDEKARLLRGFLSVMDNLEQALAHLQRDDALFQGVRVTYDGMQALLRIEGVENIPALGQPFDPTWQEAVAMIPAQPDQEHEMMVLAEEQKGYRLGERLLRPARVVVAKK